MSITKSRSTYPMNEMASVDAEILEGESIASSLDASRPSAAEVHEALQQILASESFRSSQRGREFLNFVVQYQLENHPEPLKERTIGVALFHRSVDYATGDDSVVRAQAREVRRRLERYYSANADSSKIRIDLPLGSYAPVFRKIAEPGTLIVARPADLPSPSQAALPPVKPRLSRRRLWWGGAAVIAVLIVVVSWVRFKSPSAQETTLTQFWAPALASSRPLLICLPKPILYRPSAELYKRSAQSPGEFDREIDRMTKAPHLSPDEMIRWGDMWRYYDYGVGEGDVQASFRLSKLLNHLGKDSEVRIGSGFSSADLRNSPAVLIGAFSNPRSMQMIANLPLAFIDDNQGLRIQERGPSGRSWFPKHGVIGEDYGLVTRLTDSITGQFVVIVAGIEGSGSDAAADLIVRPDGLNAALEKAQPDWQRKNVQILVSTTVQDSVASSPKVVAVKVW